MKKQRKQLFYIHTTLLCVGLIVIPMLTHAYSPINTRFIKQHNTTQQTKQPNQQQDNLEKFNLIKTRIQNIINDSIQRISIRKQEVESNQLIQPEIKQKLTEQLDKDTEFFQSQLSIIQQISTPQDLKIIADRVFSFIKGHKERVKQLRDAVIAPQTQNFIDQAKEKSATILERLQTASEHLKTSGADTTNLDSLIEQYKISVENLSQLDTNNPENIKAALQYLRSKLREVTDEISLLISQFPKQ